MPKGRKKDVVRAACPHVKGEKFSPVMYGLRGIQDIFGVSKATASRYARGMLRDAVTKNGNVIVIDVESALRCFGVENPGAFMK